MRGAAGFFNSRPALGVTASLIFICEPNAGLRIFVVIDESVD